jgi:chemotaxis protein CheZ
MEHRDRDRSSGSERRTVGQAFMVIDAADELAALRDEIAALRVDLAPAKNAAPDKPDLDKAVRGEIAKLIRMLGQLKAELAQLKHPKLEEDRFKTATSELDMIVASTEDATASVLSQSEIIQAAAGRLPEEGDHGNVRAEIEVAALEIMQACSFQDLTGQRTTKVIRALREVEGRVATMVELWGREAFLDVDLPEAAASGEDQDAALLNGPAATGQGLSQDDIDALFD